MLKLWYFDVTEDASVAHHRGFVGVLSEATEVSVSRQVNGDYTLSFKYPRSGEYADSVKFRECAVVECEGQLFRVIKIIRSSEPNMDVECEHVFNCDSKRIHLPNVASTSTGDFIGEDAYTVLQSVADRYANTSGRSLPFKLLTNDELLPLGMSRIKVNIDFESMDKTNLYDVMQKIIECAGIGEIYVDNYDIAIVDRIGKDTNAVISTALNATGITIERDTSELITRLYPYGKDDLTIANAKANTDGVLYVENFGQYFEDENTRGAYGIIEGYRDYSDYTDPDKLFERALWEIDPENPNRLDKPAINISGTVADLSKIGTGMETVQLGDTVKVIDNGEEFAERIISGTWHPFEPIADSVSIGRVKKDMFFYLRQLGILSKRYKSASTNDGKIQSVKLSGMLSKLSVIDGELCYNGKKIVTEEV